MYEGRNMLDHKTGIWYEEINEPYALHFDNWYYVNYYIEKALVAISDVLAKDKYEVQKYTKPAVYYHIKVEQLLLGVAQIDDRFYAKNENREDLVYNRTVYNYTKQRFPTLTKKEFRNFVVHIFDPNKTHIKAFKQVGGFNFFDSDTETELAGEYIHGKYQNIALDLVNNLIWIKEKSNDYIPKKISIVDLQKELEDLKTTNDTIGSYCGFSSIYGVKEKILND